MKSDENNFVATTVSHGAIYAVADIARQIVAFIMLPIYTSYLTPEDYGVVELFSLTVAFVQIFLGMRISSAIAKYYYAEKTDNEKNSVIGTAFIIGVCFSFIGSICIYFASESISMELFGGDKYVTLIKLYSIILMLQAGEEVGFAFVRMQQKPKIFLSVSLVKLAMQVSLNIYFIVFLDMGVAGVVYSAVISSLVMFLIGAGYVYWHTHMRFSIVNFKRLLVFSYPLILSYIGGFYITFGDRYFLNHHASLADVGVYALAYKFAFLLSFFTWGPFSKIWETQSYQIHNMGLQKEMFSKFFRGFCFVTLLMALGIALLSEEVIKLMSAKEFWVAYDVIPILVLAYAFQYVMYFLNFSFYVTGKTFEVAYASFIAVVVISVSYFSLIPKYLAFGAAISTLIAFVAQFYYTYYRGKMLYDMYLPIMPVIKLLIYALILFFISLLFPDDIVISAMLKILLIALYIFGIYKNDYFTKGEKDLVAGFIKRGRKDKLKFM